MGEALYRDKVLENIAHMYLGDNYDEDDYNHLCDTISPIPSCIFDHAWNACLVVLNKFGIINDKTKDAFAQGDYDQNVITGGFVEHMYEIAEENAYKQVWFEEWNGTSWQEWEKNDNVSAEEQ